MFLFLSPSPAFLFIRAYCTCLRGGFNPLCYSFGLNSPRLTAYSIWVDGSEVWTWIRHSSPIQSVVSKEKTICFGPSARRDRLSSARCLLCSIHVSARQSFPSSKKDREAKLTSQIEEEKWSLGFMRNICVTRSATGVYIFNGLTP